MTDSFSRTRLLLGPEAMDRLCSSRVAVFGIGGVGSYAVEALVRAGIGSMDLIDYDRVSLSNLNRQIIATRETVGLFKVDVAADRIHKINPDCKVKTYKTFFLPSTRNLFDFTQYDYVVDAIDTVSGKLALIEAAKEVGTPVISSMGAGNKLDPTAFRVADIYRTSVCPLARVMRAECRRRGIRDLKVVYSMEPPFHPAESFSSADADDNGFVSSESSPAPHRRNVPGSVSFVPSVAGLIIAGEVIRDLSFP